MPLCEDTGAARQTSRASRRNCQDGTQHLLVGRDGQSGLRTDADRHSVFLDLRTASASPTLADMADASSSPRLPTRCPMCKAAGIFRMPDKSSGAVIWFYCDFCKHMWKVRIENAKHE